MFIGSCSSSSSVPTILSSTAAPVFVSPSCVSVGFCEVTSLPQKPQGPHSSIKWPETCHTNGRHPPHNPSLSDGQPELLSLQDLGVVDPEKVRIQHRLDHARDPGNLVHIALREVAVQPVGDVEGAVEAQGEEVVGCDRFGFARALKHEELGEDGDGFEPDAEGPEDLRRVLVFLSYYTERTLRK